MKRDRGDEGRGTGKEKRKRTIVSTSYDGWIVNGKREGLYRVRFSGDCDPVCMIVPYEKGKKCGTSYSYVESTGKLLNFVVFENDFIVDVRDVSSAPVEQSIISFDNGARWEGQMCLDYSSGQGEEYNEDNELVFKGMEVNYLFEGTGTSYYTDLEARGKRAKEYVGEWKCGLKHGFGTLYNRRGEKVWHGRWCNGERLDSTTVIHGEPSPLSLYSLTEDLTIGDNSLNTLEQLDLCKLERVQSIHIGAKCCVNMKSFSLVGLRALQTLHVGKSSFTTTDPAWKAKRLHASTTKEKGCSLQISKNPCLRSVVLEENAFSDFVVFELTCLFSSVDSRIVCPALEILQIGRAGATEKEEEASFSFFYASSLVLEELPRLREVELGCASFFTVRHVVFRSDSAWGR